MISHETFLFMPRQGRFYLSYANICWAKCSSINFLILYAMYVYIFNELVGKWVRGFQKPTFTCTKRFVQNPPENRGRECVFYYIPVSIGRGAVSYKTGFPEDWRSHCKCDF